MTNYDAYTTATRQLDTTELLQNHTPTPHIQITVLLGIGHAILSVADELRELRRRSW